MVSDMTTGRAGPPRRMPTDVADRAATRPPRQAAHTAPPDGAAALFTRLKGLAPGPEHEAVRAELVRMWLPMAHRIASRFRDRGEDIEDLRQVAALGLVKAVDRYDPEQGPFESYAVPTITGEVKRHFRDRLWAVRVPRRVQELRNQVRLARRELTQRPGSREPTRAELAAHAGLSEHEVVMGLEALQSYRALSLDAAIRADGDGEGDGYSLADTLGFVDPALEIVVDRQTVNRALRKLPERERAILYLRFFEGMTQKRIAERFGISQMHVSRLIARSCAWVRDETMAPPLPAGV
ncbi:RNA polymerase sigma factor SigF [Streptomyces sp. NPDC054842]